MTAAPISHRAAVATSIKRMEGIPGPGERDSGVKANTIPG